MLAKRIIPCLDVAEGRVVKGVQFQGLRDAGDPVEVARAIAHELEQFSPTLAERPRWLVLNKLDLVLVEEREARVAAIVEGLGWTGPVFRISAISGEGTDALVQAAHRWLTGQRRLENEDEEAAE